METKETMWFKSLNENFVKEKSGIKANTVRFTDDWSKREWDTYYHCKYITIQNVDTDETFTRTLTDKTTWRNLAVLSWHSDEESL